MTTTNVMTGEAADCLEKKVNKRKRSWIASGLAALTLAAGSFLANRYLSNTPEERTTSAVTETSKPEKVPDTTFYKVKSEKILPEAQPYYDAAVTHIQQKYGIRKEDIKVYSADHISSQWSINRFTEEGDFGYYFLFVHPDAYMEVTVDKPKEVIKSSHYVPKEKEKEVITLLEDILKKPLFVRKVEKADPVDLALVTSFDIYPQPVSQDVYTVTYLRGWGHGSRDYGEYYVDFGANLLVGHDFPM